MKGIDFIFVFAIGAIVGIEINAFLIEAKRARLTEGAIYPNGQLVEVCQKNACETNISGHRKNHTF